ncbi:hypothetical protein [Moraxella lacunata]|uniref:hypothetical protein n=1 Tax=Moraxella lacunata TaxID=477 RepID=UPI003EE38129
MPSFWQKSRVFCVFKISCYNNTPIIAEQSLIAHYPRNTHANPITTLRADHHRAKSTLQHHRHRTCQSQTQIGT